MELDYDGDTNDESQYCPHGTFIGSWWGPDYLCQWCEDGISVEEMRAILKRSAYVRANRKIDEGINLLSIITDKIPYTAAMATALVDYFVDDTSGFVKAWRDLQALEAA